MLHVSPAAGPLHRRGGAWLPVVAWGKVQVVHRISGKLWEPALQVAEQAAIETGALVPGVVTRKGGTSWR